MASVGGQDDNNVIIWDLQNGKAVAGNSCANLGYCCSFYNNDNSKLIVGGKYLLRVWEIDYNLRKMNSIDCALGQIKRVTTCLLVDPNDENVYAGTTSGDLLCVQLRGPKNFKYLGPKQKITNGIVSLCFSPDANIVVGGGDGTLAVLNRESLLKAKSISLMGGITSLSGRSNFFYIGTTESVMYLLNYNKNLDATLLATCHSQRINDVAYPRYDDC